MTHITNQHSYYDEYWGRYILTEEAVKMQLGVNIHERLKTLPDTYNPQIFLKRVSDMVYNWAEGQVPDAKRISYLAAKDFECNKYLIQAMLRQVEYMIYQGDIANESGIDWSNSSLLDAEFYNRRLSPEVKEILANSGLIYRGTGYYVPGDIHY